MVMYITQRPVGLCHAPPFVHTYVGNVGKFQMTQFIQTWQNLWQQLPLLTQRRSGLLSALQFRGVNSAGVNMAQTSVGLSACSSPRLVKPTCLSGITGPPTFAVLSPWRIKYKVCNTRCSLQRKNVQRDKQVQNPLCFEHNQSLFTSTRPVNPVYTNKKAISCL